MVRAVPTGRVAVARCLIRAASMGAVIRVELLGLVCTSDYTAYSAFTVNSCYNLGTVRCGQNTGGIASRIRALSQHCYNYGTIQADPAKSVTVAAVAADNPAGSGCYYCKTVSSISYQ